MTTQLQNRLLNLLQEYGKEAPDEQSSFRDLLTDVRHVANIRGLDFDFALSGSGEVYDEETAETQEEIEAHIANDEFKCHECGAWEDVEDSIKYEHDGELYCKECAVQASCGCWVPRHLIIFHEGITTCETCYHRIK